MKKPHPYMVAKLREIVRSDSKYALMAEILLSYVTWTAQDEIQAKRIIVAYDKERLSNPGRGRGVTFHGAFKSKAKARIRERLVPGSFILHRGGRFIVMKWRMGSNPRRKKVVRIYGRVLRIEAQKTGKHRCDSECRKFKHKYFHDFKGSPQMLGLSPGDRLTVPDGTWPILIIPKG